jgi:transcription elongation factor Elf1
MISISDILAILDKIPIWKKLKEMPSKIESLEKRIAELENKTLKPNEVCPRCHSEEYSVVSTYPIKEMLRTFNVRQYQCKVCDFKEEIRINASGF